MINIIAKIIAVPVKIISILLSFLMIFKSFTRIMGILLYIPIIPLAVWGLCCDPPKWEMSLTALMFPTILTFAEVPVQLLIMLTEKLYKWLVFKDHRSARIQNEEYIRRMREQGEVEDCSEELQKLSEQLIDIYKNGG